MGLYLSKPEITKQYKSEDHQWFASASIQVQGWKIKQDEVIFTSLNFDKQNSLYAIIEQYGGEEMAQFLIDNIITVLKNDPEYQNKQYEKALTNTYTILDQQLKDKYRETSNYQGFTLLSTLITEENIYVSNIGLSRCIARSEGKHRVMSIDHYPLNDSEKQRILAAGGEVWENRMNAHLPFSRAMGFFEYKNNTLLDQSKQLIIPHPSMKWIERHNSEFLLMGSHGFWQTWTNVGIAEVVMERLSQKKSLQEILEAVVDSIIAPNVEQEYGKENITCILIQIKQN